MEPRNSIEKAIAEADGNNDRVRIEMICPRFSHKKQLYSINYEADKEFIYIIDPANTHSSYRYKVSDFEKWLESHGGAIVVLTEPLKSFNFVEYLQEKTIEDVIICYRGSEYTLKPAIPSMFDINMKKGTSGKLYMITDEVTNEINLKELETLIKEGQATIKMR